MTANFGKKFVHDTKSADVLFFQLFQVYVYIYSMLVAILPCRVRGAVSNHTAPLA